MPIYEYQCAACGGRKELILKPGEEGRPVCPSCRKRMRRVISPTAFILKGQGWYVTDYPSHDRKKGMEAEKGGGAAKEAAPAEKASSSADAKPGPAKPAADKKKPRRG